MAAPLRIGRKDKGLAAVSAEDGDDKFKFYLDALLKMIPAEAVSLYLAGLGVIPGTESIALIGWSIFCLLVVVIVRVIGTSDRKAGVNPDWVHVVISMIAFVIWMYSLGGPFVTLGIHVPYIGSLLVLAWTFLVPALYSGPKS